MDKKKYCIFIYLISICLCACHMNFSEKESYNEKAQMENVEKQDFLNNYNEFAIKENAKKVALIYIDEDSIPELLLMKDGEYRIYTYDGDEVKSVTMADTEIKASTYGMKYDFEESEEQMFYWFEYVPYKGLIRVHNTYEQTRHDYYLKYQQGKFVKELETQSCDYVWKTYDANIEIENNEFLEKLLDLGYDKLIPCGFLYEDVSTAYENLDVITDNLNVLENFVNGEVDAVCSVDGTSDIDEMIFVMKSYKEVFDDITGGEKLWGSNEYIDFDNDGKDELIIHGYAGACVYFDVIGDTVYNILNTGGTADVASVALYNGKMVIKRTDLTHSGRKSYRLMQYDACGCLLDYFQLYVGYEGTNYSEEDVFMYRNKEISMKEFENIVNSIHNAKEMDFSISSGTQEIALDMEITEFLKNSSVLFQDSIYVGEIYVGEVAYKYYKHEDEHLTVYTSNLYYDVKDRDFDEYHITQIRIKTSEYSTFRGITIGTGWDEVVSMYGQGKNIQEGEGILVYSYDNWKVEYKFDDEKKVAEIEMYIVAE